MLQCFGCLWYIVCRSWLPLLLSHKQYSINIMRAHSFKEFFFSFRFFSQWLLAVSHFFLPFKWVQLYWEGHGYEIDLRCPKSVSCSLHMYTYICFCVCICSTQSSNFARLMATSIKIICSRNPSMFPEIKLELMRLRSFSSLSLSPHALKTANRNFVRQILEIFLNIGFCTEFKLQYTWMYDAIKPHHAVQIYTRTP